MKNIKVLCKITAAVIVMVVMMTSLRSADAAKEQYRELVVGRAVTMDTNYEVGDVAITDPSVVDYIVQSNRKEIYLNPQREGRATLTIWDDKDRVKEVIVLNVVSVKIDTVFRHVKSELRNVSGISIKLVGNRSILITGEVGSSENLKLVDEVAKKYSQVQSKVTLSKHVLEVTADQIEKAIDTPGITVRPVRGKLVMEGLTYSKDVYKKIDTVAKLYKDDIINLVEVRAGTRRPGFQKTVSLNVYFMEIKNSAIRSFGINWAPGSTVQSAAQQNAGSGNMFGLIDFNSIVGFVFNLLPKIRWVHENNRGRVLEKANFVVKSGDPVDFYSGTQIPYFTSSSVTFKEVGIRINAEPITHGDNVDMKIKVNVSSPSATVSQGVDTNEINTTVYVKQDEAVVLGGLLRNNDVKTINKVPPNLDTHNALFTLFLSRDFQTNKSQFYIFMEPVVVNAPSTAEMELKRWLELNDAVNATRR
jgi:Flp pilus assembly secretin CpaC